MNHSELLQKIREENPDITREKSFEILGIKLATMQQRLNKESALRKESSEKLDKASGYVADVSVRRESANITEFDRAREAVDIDVRQVTELYIRARDNNDVEAGRLLHEKIRVLLKILEIRNRE